MTTLSITVYSSGAGIGSGPDARFFEKEIDWPGLPGKGDWVEWIYAEGDDERDIPEEWSGNGRVKSRWFHGDGTVVIELTPYQLCETAEDQKMCTGGYREAWREEHDGEIFEVLARSGFTEISVAIDEGDDGEGLMDIVDQTPYE